MWLASKTKIYFCRKRRVKFVNTISLFSTILWRKNIICYLGWCFRKQKYECVHFCFYGEEMQLWKHDVVCSIKAISVTRKDKRRTIIPVCKTKGGSGSGLLNQLKEEAGLICEMKEEQGLGSVCKTKDRLGTVCKMKEEQARISV